MDIGDGRTACHKTPAWDGEDSRVDVTHQHYRHDLLATHKRKRVDSRRLAWRRRRGGQRSRRSLRQRNFHMNVLAGCEFFTVEVLTWRRLVTYYVLFFLHLESRRVSVAGITRHPDQEWMEQIARSATQDTWGYLHACRYVLHDRDTKFCASFRSALASGGVKTIPLPAKSRNLNAFAERWVRSVKQECLSKVILFGERPLSRVLTEYSRHYHNERNHQGKDNQLLFPDVSKERNFRGSIEC